MVGLKIERLFQSLFRNQHLQILSSALSSQPRRREKKKKGSPDSGTQSIVKGGRGSLTENGGIKKSFCPNICDILASSLLSIPGTLEARIIFSSQGMRRIFSEKFYQPKRKEWKTQTREFHQRITMKPPLRHFPSWTHTQFPSNFFGLSKYEQTEREYIHLVKPL